MIQTKLPKHKTLLVARGQLVGSDLPNGVDAVVPDHDAQALIAILKLLKGF